MGLEAWAEVGLPLAVAAVAAWGGLGVARLHSWLPDPRLARLSGFLWFFAASWAMHAAGVVFFLQSGAVAVERAVFDARDALFLLHHGLLLVAMALAALVYRRPRTDGGAHDDPPGDASHANGGPGPGALAPLLFWLEPSLRLLESGVFFYLVVRTALNHRARRDMGSLRVALGFLALLMGHAWLLYVHTPLGPHDLVGDALALVGILLIVSALPRRRM